MNKVKEFVKKFDYPTLALILGFTSTSYVLTLDIAQDILLVLLFTFCYVFYSKPTAFLIGAIVFSLMMYVYATNGQQKHKYLLVFENGTSICASKHKDIPKECFSEYKNLKDGDNLGKFIRHEYIGKQFYK